MVRAMVLLDPNRYLGLMGCKDSVVVLFRCYQVDILPVDRNKKAQGKALGLEIQ